MAAFFAYIPYAALGYCVAQVASDAWPALRSQLGSASRFSTRGGHDGEATRQHRPHRRRNQAMAFEAQAPADVADDYCFDSRTYELVGEGGLAGKRFPNSHVAFYTESGQERVDISFGGDVRQNFPVCAGASFTSEPYDEGPGEAEVDTPTGPPPTGVPPAMGVPPYVPPQEIPEGGCPPEEGGWPEGCPPIVGPCDEDYYADPPGPHAARQSDCPRRNHRAARQRTRWG